MASIKWHKMIIWIVETDGNYSTSLRSTLVERGCTVNEYTDSSVMEEALQQGGQPHLLIMNADMEEGRCTDLLHRIRNRRLGKNPFLPVFLSTWDEGDEHSAAMLDTGCDKVLPKPFSRSDAMEWVQEYCRVMEPKYVATAQYIGPERRFENAKRPSRLRPVAVPNVLAFAAQLRPVTGQLIDHCWTLLATERIRANAFSVLSAFHLALQYPGSETPEEVAKRIAGMCNDAILRMDGPEFKTSRHAFAAARAFAESVAEYGWNGDETDRHMAQSLSDAIARSVIADKSEEQIAELIQLEIENWLNFHPEMLPGVENGTENGPENGAETNAPETVRPEGGAKASS